MRSQTTRVVSGVVQANPLAILSIAGGEFTVQKTATGQFYVNVRARLLSGTASLAQASGQGVVRAVVAADGTLNVNVFDISTVAALDRTFNFVAVVAA